MPFPSIFGTPNPVPDSTVPVPVPVPGTPAVPAPVVSPVVPLGTKIPDPNVPTLAPDPNLPPVVEEPKSPLDVYKDLWETKPVDKNNPEPEEIPLVAPLDPKALQEKLAKVDFTTAVTSETLAAIEAGGEGANAAFLTAMNEIGRNVMTQAMLVNNKLMETAVERTKTQTLASIPELIRTQTLANNLSNNPIFNNPAIKPLVDMVQKQMAIKNPAATPDELTKMAQDYLAVTVTALTPEVKVKSNPLELPETTDFSNFLDMEQVPGS